jgi:hypothetical protein
MATLLITTGRGTVEGANTTVTSRVAQTRIQLDQPGEYTFTARPDPGFRFVDWGTNMEIVGGSATTPSITVRVNDFAVAGTTNFFLNGFFSGDTTTATTATTTTADATTTATADATTTANIDVVVEGGLGTITGPGGPVTLGSSYNGVFGLTAGASVPLVLGSTYTFEAVADAGYYFEGWSTNLEIVRGYLTDNSITVRPTPGSSVISGRFRRTPIQLPIEEDFFAPIPSPSPSPTPSSSPIPSPSPTPQLSPTPSTSTTPILPAPSLSRTPLPSTTPIPSRIVITYRDCISGVLNEGLAPREYREVAYAGAGGGTCWEPSTIVGFQPSLSEALTFTYQRGGSNLPQPKPITANNPSYGVSYRITMRTNPDIIVQPSSFTISPRSSQQFFVNVTPTLLDKLGDGTSTIEMSVDITEI